MAVGDGRGGTDEGSVRERCGQSTNHIQRHRRDLLSEWHIEILVLSVRVNRASPVVFNLFRVIPPLEDPPPDHFPSLERKNRFLSLGKLKEIDFCVPNLETFI